LVDTHTRWAVISLVCGDHTAQTAAAFLNLAIERFRAAGITLRGILTDRGPEFRGTAFTTHVHNSGLRHTWTPPRSPNHNAVCERFHGTVLHEFYPVAFHREFFTSIERLDTQLQG
jgi:transposase InsO family protein